MSETKKPKSPTKAKPERPEATSEPAFLGEGAQYKVYDLGNGRVKKVPQSQSGSEKAIATWHKGTAEEISEYAKYMQLLSRRGAEHVDKVIRSNPDSSRFFGNPTFDKNGVVEQDKVELLGDVMDRSAPEKSRDLIRKYIAGVKESWDYGCYDWVFNLCTNTGVDAEGEVVMMDFGEMGLDKETAVRLIHDKPWERSYDTTHRLSSENHAYFIAEAAESITPDSLDRHWQSSLPPEMSD